MCSTVEPHKLLRTSSSNSMSSDAEEPELSPLSPSERTHKHKHPAILISALLALVVAIAIGFGFAHVFPTTLASLPSVLRLPPLSFWQAAASPSTVTATPAGNLPIEELVVSILRAHERAKRGRPDFALRAHGGRVSQALTSTQAGIMSAHDDDPGIAIDDDVHVGSCWKLHALPSQLGIRLPRMLYPSHITVEHLPSEIVLDIGEAPKNMTLWGVVDGKHNKQAFEALVAAGLSDYSGQVPTIARGLLWAPLASFTYDIHHEDPVQTFPVSQSYAESGLAFGNVAVEVLDNWGGDSTCLYRVRIHGTPV
ncbi:hypothetical protein VTO73DRAFT_6929 [Trametes versicolor]